MSGSLSLNTADKWTERHWGTKASSSGPDLAQPKCAAACAVEKPVEKQQGSLCGILASFFPRGCMTTQSLCWPFSLLSLPLSLLAILQASSFPVEAQIKVYLSIFGTIASPPLFGKKIFITKTMHFIKEELLNNLIPVPLRKSVVNALLWILWEHFLYRVKPLGSHDLCIFYHFTFFTLRCIMDIFLINTYTSVICLLLDAP